MRNMAVIEDDKTERESLIAFLRRYGETEGEEFKCFAFLSAEEFLTGYTAIYDAVFMDIGLPGLNGMDAAKKLHELDRDTVLIFVTNLAQFAVGGYEVGAFDFILKPVSYAGFCLKFKRIMQKIRSNDDTHILIKGKECNRRVSASDIKYLEVVNHKLIYHLETDDIVSSGTMREAMLTFPPESFVLCNQSFLVNLKYVNEFNDTEVRVGDEWLLVSRAKRKDFFRAVNLYFNRRALK